MNMRLTRLAVALGFSGALVLSTASCSLLPRAADDQAAPSVASRPAQLRVVQMNFGRDAYFAACAEPACPSVTQKTLPQAELRQTVALVAPVRPEPAVVESSPAPPPAPAPAAKPARPKVEEIHILLTFPFASAALTDTAKDTLRRALPTARESDRIVISGRTDSVGSDEVNQKLALARALAVRNYMRDAVPDLPNVISIDAKGRCCFIAPNDNEGGRSKNRRVEVVFLSTGVM
ncbi:MULTISPECIES: OmpA family protein [Piscinibacter]|uniref:OmpA family protein n=1 Tax=Piscinibacter TaxID=1114981 RepID=UPI000FDCFF64|nr:OmpA family protein [Piscinibacter defluvii]